jgi:hypothetical protein
MAAPGWRADTRAGRPGVITITELTPSVLQALRHKADCTKTNPSQT